MKPVDAYEEIASIVVSVVKKPFREQAITWEEWDSISEQVAVFIGKQKARCHGDGEICENERCGNAPDGRSSSAR